MGKNKTFEVCLKNEKKEHFLKLIVKFGIFSQFK